MKRLYEGGMSREHIARRLSRSHTTVSVQLRRAGVQLRARVHGPEHALWRGRKVTPDGYVLVWIAETDPMYGMTNCRHMVLEHRLVMARHLGRPLRSDEQVHHRNGQRDDNRIENLELRGFHGSGQAMCCARCGSIDLVPQEVAYVA